MQEKHFKTSRDDSRTLIDQLLAEQRELTAVETFSRAHDNDHINGEQYRHLIPLSVPGPGEQYVFEVELEKCSGCKACVTACHSLNGLDDGETWRDVGMLVSDDWRRPMQQFITTTCHHCVDPACLNGCPVLAYEKDALTGIVRHLDDQCIGCQYCILKCPYDAPKYSHSRGIVRKCDMCSQRLASNEAPACVQACPNEAIRITNVALSAIRASYAGSANIFLPASPDPLMTLPATRYTSQKPLPWDLIPSNAQLKLQPPHWPLVIMLVGTQLGVGGFVLLPLLPVSLRPALAVASVAATLVGFGSSMLHLGKPLKAWRSFLGLRRSWLSREILVFSLFAPMAAAAAFLGGAFHSSAVAASPVAGFIGLIGVYCSAKIYDDTQRPFWRGIRSTGKFFGTALILGTSAAWLMAAISGRALWWLPLGVALAASVKLSGEHRLLRRADHPAADQVSPKGADFFAWSLAQSALLMRDRMGLLTRLRFACGMLGGVALPLLTLLSIRQEALLAAVCLGLSLCGELIERYAFFRAVVPPRMPGVV